MKRSEIDFQYMPSRLFDVICQTRGLKTDVELAALLGVGSAQICKVKHRVQPLSGQLLLRIHEVTGMEIGELKGLMGDRRAKHRLSRAKLANAVVLRAKPAGGRAVSSSQIDFK